MAYVTRTKADPGDVGLAADQQQSIDNEEFLYESLVGEALGGHGGTVKGFVHKSAVPDASATEVFTITTTNETGSVDGGGYSCVFEGMVIHGADADNDNAVKGFKAVFARGVDQAGVGANSAVAEVYETAVAASDAAARTMTTVTMTVVETSEYVMSVLFNINVGGSAASTSHVWGQVTVFYDEFTTVPVITSAE